jgi:hypothetical protein
MGRGNKIAGIIKVANELTFEMRKLFGIIQMGPTLVFFFFFFGSTGV